MRTLVAGTLRSVVGRDPPYPRQLGETERSAPSSTSARDGQPAACAPDLLDTALRTEADSHLDEAEVVHIQPAYNATKHFQQGGDLA